MALTRSTESPSSPTRLSSTAQRKRRKSAAETAVAEQAMLAEQEDSEGHHGNKERSKLGCWTCRIRRKKCDVRPVNGKCETCIRLKLECLGWGAKRPDWMRDKDAVELKKAEIKRQLATQGMIRGQAKTPAIIVNPPPKTQAVAQDTSRSASMTGLRIDMSLSQPAYSPRSNPSSTNLNLLTNHSPSNTLSSGATTPRQMEAEITLPTMEMEGYEALFNNSATPSADEDSFVKSPINASSGFPSADAAYDLDSTLAASALGIHAFNPLYSVTGEYFSAFAVNGSLSGSMGHTSEGIVGSLGSSAPDLMAASDLAMDSSMAGVGAHQSGLIGSTPSNTLLDTSAMVHLRLPPVPNSTTLGTLQSGTASPAGSLNMTNAPSSMGMGSEIPMSPFAAFMDTLGDPFASSVAGPSHTSNIPVNTSMVASGSSSAFLQPQAPYPHHPQHLYQHQSGLPLGNSQQGTQDQSAESDPTEKSLTQTFSSYPPSAHPTFGGFTVEYAPKIRGPIGSVHPTPFLTKLQETLVFYYFNRGVRTMQYLLADDGLGMVTTGASLTDVFYDLIIRDPKGAVTNAICSLASLHDTRLQIAHGLIHPADLHAHASAQRFYGDSVRLLAQKEGAFTEVEAIASLHLLSFWLFCGGGGDWPSALLMAGDWYAKSEVMRAGVDPAKAIRELSPSGRFAAQGTMWMDILGSVSLRRVPRFLDLYRRLRRHSHSPTNPQKHGYFTPNGPATCCGVALSSVMGCDDDVMFAIAETAALAAWKEEQKERGVLSIRELCRRGDAIEDLLNTCCLGPRRSRGFSSATSSPSQSSASAPINPTNRPQPSVWDPYHVASIPSATISEVLDLDLPIAASRLTGSPTPPGSVSPPPVATSSAAPSQAHAHSHDGRPITLRQLSSNVFREAALLYLYTIVSGCEPNVPEIQAGVIALIEAITAIPSTDMDRSLAFPITIGGCMANTQEQRDFFIERLEAQGTAVGNGSQVKLLVETVWKRRDAGETDVCWRETMNELKFDLLLV